MCEAMLELICTCMCAFAQKSLQEKLEGAYLSMQEKFGEYEQKLNTTNTKNSQVCSTKEMLCRYFTHGGEDIRNRPFSPVHIAVWTQLQRGGRYNKCCMIHEWFLHSPSYQIS